MLGRLLHWVRSRLKSGSASTNGSWQPGKDSEAILHLLIDGIADYAIFLLDTEGLIQSWSPAAERIFGYKRDEIIGQPYDCLFPTAHRGEGRPGVELRFAGVHGRFEDTALRQRRDGSPFWAETVICPLLDALGHRRGYSNVTRDITERRLAESALRQKDEELHQARKMEAIGRLAGGVAHDFNNLITGIIGLSEDVRDQLPFEDPKREDLEEILKAATRASRLTRQLLAFGRRQMAAPQVLNMNAVIRDMEKMLRRLLGADVELVFDLAPSLGAIRVDPSHLEQVLVNLMVNARDAMPSGGRIRMETRDRRVDQAHPIPTAPAGEYVSLRVEDTGTGMNDETISHLFEPFFTTKEKDKGTGLGLATVYGIVKQNRGEILVESEIGKGTAFTVLFPKVYETALPVPGSPSDIPVAAGERILLVDDEPIVRHAAERALGKRGYEVVTADSPEAALALAAKHPGAFDLLLTDLVMPGMSGQDLAKRLREGSPRIAVLFMSGYSEDLAVNRGMLGDGAAFIEKSFSPDLLAAKVAEVLAARHSSPSKRSHD
jgi:two-component system, cell cycle sensor histidine kinase and response regulator CckA